jgi:site-specific recombinase XerD
MHATTLPSPAVNFGDSVAGFFQALAAKNRSPETLRAYRTDISQFLIWLNECTGITRPQQLTRQHLIDYLAYLAETGLSGVARARKLAALREYCRHLTDELKLFTTSPADGIQTPRRERRTRTYLIPAEYNPMLAAATSSVRDAAILQLFLQTGVRVSELCALTVDDIDFRRPMLIVRGGKGMADREINLARKAAAAVKNWLDVRPTVSHPILFVNRFGQPLVDRGVRRVVFKYRQAAGLNKSVTPHTLRHTFATYKAAEGVPTDQIRRWLGHQRLDTTQIYIHLAMKDAAKVMEATSL